MGDPATPSPADRAATRELAKRIVEAVRNDERIDLGIRTGLLFDHEVNRLETLVFRLAQEIESCLSGSHPRST